MSALASVQALLPTATQVGNPAINIAIFAAFVVVTLGIVIRASRNNTLGRGLLRRRPRVHRAPERHRDLR